jgi:ABC-type uncharacterized transport system permease subunit
MAVTYSKPVMKCPEKSQNCDMQTVLDLSTSDAFRIAALISLFIFVVERQLKARSSHWTVT